MANEKSETGKEKGKTARERAQETNKQRAEQRLERHKKAGYPTIDGSDWNSLEGNPPSPTDAPTGFVWVRSGEGTPELKAVEEVKPRGKSTGHFWTQENNYQAPPIEEPDNTPEQTESTEELPAPPEEP